MIPNFDWACPGVFAPLVGALVYKISGGFEQSSLWVRFPYTPAQTASHLVRETLEMGVRFQYHTREGVRIPTGALARLLSRTGNPFHLSTYWGTNGHTRRR